MKFTPFRGANGGQVAIEKNVLPGMAAGQDVLMKLFVKLGNLPIWKDLFSLKTFPFWIFFEKKSSRFGHTFPAFSNKTRLQMQRENLKTTARIPGGIGGDVHPDLRMRAAVVRQISQNSGDCRRTAGICGGESSRL